jgi:transcriptional regulator with XRE-family HTH domain
MDAHIFWATVKRLMKSHGITQWQFAEYIRVPFSTLTGWMRDNIMPDLGTSYNIAIALGVSLDYLPGAASKDERNIQKAA